MPELPDVETWRRYVEATALHREVAAVDVDAPRMLKSVTPDRLKAALEGHSFATTARHGKYMFAGLSEGGWLLLHFGMTGHLKYLKDPDGALDGARLILRFANDYHLAGFWPRRLGRIGLVDDPVTFAEAEGLGPDALALDQAAFAEILAKRRGTVKAALMDQGFIAGVGNVYSDEILFQARIDPRAAPRQLEARQTRALYRAMVHVLETAIERQADPDRLPRSWLLPRRHEGARCPRCGGPVARIKASGRTAYLCPACQGGDG